MHQHQSHGNLLCRYQIFSNILELSNFTFDLIYLLLLSCFYFKISVNSFYTFRLLALLCRFVFIAHFACLCESFLYAVGNAVQKTFEKFGSRKVCIVLYGGIFYILKKCLKMERGI